VEKVPRAREGNDRAEKLSEAGLFSGMEMAVDFDPAQRNLISLRQRDEETGRSRVDNDRWIPSFLSTPRQTYLDMRAHSASEGKRR